MSGVTQQELCTSEEEGSRAVRAARGPHRRTPPSLLQAASFNMSVFTLCKFSKPVIRLCASLYLGFSDCCVSSEMPLLLLFKTTTCSEGNLYSGIFKQMHF